MRMPVLFVGHGSPMNAIEDNPFTKTWEALGQKLLSLHKPKAIVCISAHWETDELKVMDDEHPTQIYDMYGFPEALYQLNYAVKGSPMLAKRIQELLPAAYDTNWGIDHGTWSVLCRMFPAADIPTVQISIPRIADFSTLYQLGAMLKPLRDEGILIIGSGNVVHNLRTVSWGMEGGYPYCEAFDQAIKEAILSRNTDVILYPPLEEDRLRRSFMSTEHYAPLPFVMGATDEGDFCEVFNDRCLMGSLSMTSYCFSQEPII